MIFLLDHCRNRQSIVVCLITIVRLNIFQSIKINKVLLELCLRLGSKNCSDQKLRTWTGPILKNSYFELFVRILHQLIDSSWWEKIKCPTFENHNEFDQSQLISLRQDWACLYSRIHWPDIYESRTFLNSLVELGRGIPGFTIPHNVSGMNKIVTKNRRFRIRIEIILNISDYLMRANAKYKFLIFWDFVFNLLMLDCFPTWRVAFVKFTFSQYWSFDNSNAL